MCSVNHMRLAFWRERDDHDDFMPGLLNYQGLDFVSVRNIPKEHLRLMRDDIWQEILDLLQLPRQDRKRDRFVELALQRYILADEEIYRDAKEQQEALHEP